MSQSCSHIGTFLKLVLICGFSGVTNATLLPVGAPSSLPASGLGISPDGNFIYGANVSLSVPSVSGIGGHTQAWRWGQRNGQELLGSFVPFASSDNGSVIVGYSPWKQPGEIHTPAYWTDSGGLTYLPVFDNTGWEPFAMSQDGRVVVGNTGMFTGDELGKSVSALRWSPEGLVNLGTLGGNITVARYVSADGVVVAGHGLTQNRLPETYPDESAARTSDDGFVGGGEGFSIFRWTTDGGMQSLGTLGGSAAGLQGMSRDGSILVGYSGLSDSGEEHAFRWSHTTGMTSLGTLGGDRSSATLVSDDGSVVAGVSSLADERTHVFRWTAASGLQDLTPAVQDGRPIAMSADGRSIVGLQGDYGPSPFPPDSLFGQSPFDEFLLHDGFYWSEEAGLLTIEEWAGVTDMEHLNLRPEGMSADGGVVVGTAYNQQTKLWESWLAKRDVMINPEQLMASISGSRQIFSLANNMVGLVLNGSHHRPLAYNAAPSDRTDSCYWVNADKARFTEGGRARQGLFEVGFCSYVEDLLIGVGIGGGRQQQDLARNGKQEMDGNYLVVELNRRLSGYPILVSGVLLHGRWDADLKRGYRTFAGTDHSSGRTEAESTAFRIRADLVDTLGWRGVDATPWVSYTNTRVDVDSFNERNGSLPARFDRQSNTFEEARIGIMGSKQATQRLKVSPSLEHVVGLSGDMPGVTGDIEGVTSFSIPGYQPKKSWNKVGVDFDFAMSQKTKLSLSAHASSNGMDAQRSVSLGIYGVF